jgi:hypothetical protein
VINGGGAFRRIEDPFDVRDSRPGRTFALRPQACPRIVHVFTRSRIEDVTSDTSLVTKSIRGQVHT